MAGVSLGTWLMLATTVASAGASAYQSHRADSGSDVVQPAQLDTTGANKEKEQEEEALQDVELSDEESKKRKRQAAKSKYKVAQITSTSGVNVSGTQNKAAGVQI